MPMCAPFDSQLCPLGICGSSRCQALVYSAWLSTVTASASSWNDPPHTTPVPSSRTAHSATFPSVSYRPQPFGFLPSATLCGTSSELSANHATSFRFATLPSPPARAAYVHSATVGRRYFWFVFFESH